MRKEDLKCHFMDADSMVEVISNLYRGVVDSFENTTLDCLYDDDRIEEEASCLVSKLNDDMDKYIVDGINSGDFSICGNFNNLERDYRTKQGKDLNNIVMLFVENEELTEEMKDFQAYVQNWFFDTVGTFGIKYNFSNKLCDYLSYYEEETA